MREQDLFNRLNDTRNRVSAVYRQTVFLDTRMAAFEAVLRRPLARIIFFFSPLRVLKQVDAMQLLLMQKHDDELRAEENRRKAASNLVIPKLVVPNGR